MVEFALLCPALWGEPPSSSPNVLTSRWQKHVRAQLTGLDLTRDGQTVAFTTAPLASDGDSRLHVLDLMGREQWMASRELKILGVSLSDDGQYVAIGTMDFSIALFTRDGKLLWERQSVGLPYITPQGKSVVALNSGITGLSIPYWRCSIATVRRSGAYAAKDEFGGPLPRIRAICSWDCGTVRSC